MQLGLVVGSLHHLFQRAMNSLGTELASLAVWWALQSSFWWLYLISSIKPCDGADNATTQQRKSNEKPPTFESCVCTPSQPSHADSPSGPASNTALRCRLSKHHRVKSSLVPCCLCAFSFSNAHTHAQKREGMSGTSAVTIWQKHGSIFWQLYQGLRTIISVPDSSTGDRRSSYISLQPSTLIQFSLSQPCWNFTLPH